MTDTEHKMVHMREVLFLVIFQIQLWERGGYLIPQNCDREQPQHWMHIFIF